MNLDKLQQQALELAKPQFQLIEEVALNNTAKVLNAFHKYKVSGHLFAASTGYAYDDLGRDCLDSIWAEICSAEKALFRTQFASGTHALATVLFGLLRPGDELIAAAGSPYDTMQTVIGCNGSASSGALTAWGIKYREIPLANGQVDEPALYNAINANTKLVLIQRSRGYSLRASLNIATIEKLCLNIKRINPNCICFVDNCYGEFVEQLEPTAVGADIIAGSLIKNPGGGIAPTGGYIAGKAELVDLAAERLTAPGIGAEIGCSFGMGRLMYQGLFMAPHIVAQSLKSAVFAAAVFTSLGYETTPGILEPRTDIIQAISLKSPERLIAFCQGLQSASPVDAHVRPEPGEMPGYGDAVIMAGGTFVQGSSIELSADGPLREPYAVYLQGALSFEHGILGIMNAVKRLL